MVAAAGEPPIKDEDFAERADHDVGRFQIAMEDPARVRERDDIADAIEQPQPVGQRWQPAHTIGQTDARHQPHRVEATPIGEPPVFVNRDDAGVFQAGEHFGFARQAFLVNGAGQRGDLDGYLALELPIARAKDRAHAAAPDLLDQLVARSTEIGPVGDLLQVPRGRIRNPDHGGEIPSRSRASARNSSSVVQ